MELFNNIQKIVFGGNIQNWGEKNMILFTLFCHNNFLDVLETKSN